MNDKNIKTLIDIFGKGNVITSESDMEPYAHDETPGLFNLPEIVVKPTKQKQITELLKLANKEKFPITPRGGGTGLAGGCVATEGGVVLSLEKIDKISEIDKFNSMAVADAGAVNGNLADEAAKMELFYPVNPASMDSCTLGGNVATSAGGANAVRYGTTKDYIVGIEAILPDGRTMEAGGKLLKNATDYRLISLLLGSEGTLAVLTKLTLKLVSRPEYTIVLIIPFNDLGGIPKLLEEVSAHKIQPTMVEYMDRKTLQMAEEFLDEKLPFDISPKGQVLLRIDGNDKNELKTLFEKIGEISLEAGALDVLILETLDRQEHIWKVRKSFHDANIQIGKMIADEDIVVPRDKMLDLLSGIEQISSRIGIPISAFGHLGDGNFHVNFLAEKKEKQKAMKVLPDGLKSLFQLAVDLGGKISGEHGIGVFKKPYLKSSISPAGLNVLKGVKAAIDPNNILNPGKIL